jgi:hypothetical protein
VKSEEPMTLSFDNPKPITVSATLMRTEGPRAPIVIYWYMHGDKSWGTTASLHDLITRRAITDSLRICVNPFGVRALRREMIARRFLWYRFVTETTPHGDDPKRLEEFMREFVRNNEDFGKADGMRE